MGLFCCILENMDYDLLPPTDDWVFKLLFGNERNKSMLADLLGSFIDLPKDEYELTFLDTHLKPEAEGDKLGIVDVKVRTKSGKIIAIEIQVHPVKNIGRRMSFYKSMLIVEQLGQGDPYSAIERVICVCITCYEIFPKEIEYLNGFRFYNPKNGLCFEDIPEEIVTMELPKVPKEDDGSSGWEWLQFLRSRRREEFEMVAERNIEIRKAVDTLYELSADEKVRGDYEMRQKAWRDRLSQNEGYFMEGVKKGLTEGRIEGKLEGREEGKLEGREETARRALAEGVSLELIQKITGFDMDEIKALRS